MTFSKTITALSLAVSVSLISTCSANSAETAVQQDAETYNSSQAYSKPGAAVSYAHNLKPQLSVGETVTFTLTLDESYNAGNLTVNLGVDGAITLFPTSGQTSFDMASGASHDMDISFTANSNGRHYINVQAQAIDGSGDSKPRIFSIPVQVGQQITQKINPNMKTMDSGQNVIEMEAEEEIIFK